MQNNTSNCNKLDELCYHHFTFNFDPREVETKFSDVRFVLVAGCARRAKAHAIYLLESANIFSLNKDDDDDDDNNKVELEVLTKETSRFSLFKVGPILLANHGMGSASMSICLHELFLMCHQSNTINRITLLRFGTCGGIGVEPGTICITNRAFDPLFNEFVELKICLKTVKRSTKMDTKVANELLEISTQNLNPNKLPAERMHMEQQQHHLGGQFAIKIGATIGTNDFYEEQGRTNGAICEHSPEDKRIFLEKAKQMGVINFEMESNYLASMCNKLSVPFGVVCVALTDRLQDDRVQLSSKQMDQFERRLFWVVSLFIKQRLNLPATNCEIK